MGISKTLAIALGVALVGCDVFDPSLYQNRTSITLADRCDQDVPLVPSSETRFYVDTTKMSADYHEFGTGNCLPRDLPGNDGFVKIMTNPGEKWHVHVDPLKPELDPAVYFLPACDILKCTSRTIKDGCGAGKAEHLSFLATEKSYYVGIDSKLAGGGAFSVIVTHPICGNSTLEHSEACDDGNTDSGDGCDSSCRKELMGGAVVTENESNEMPAEANVLMTVPMTINGRIGDHCGDVDVFAIKVPEGGAMQASLVSRAGSCDGSPVRLILIAPDGYNEMVSTSATGAACPAITAQMPTARTLSAGVYYLQVSSLSTDPFEYQLKVEKP
jgi:cysteine-rich repeat protein